MLWVSSAFNTFWVYGENKRQFLGGCISRWISLKVMTGKENPHFGLCRENGLKVWMFFWHLNLFSLERNLVSLCWISNQSYWSILPISMSVLPHRFQYRTSLTEDIFFPNFFGVLSLDFFQGSGRAVFCVERTWRVSGNRFPILG